MSVCPHLLFECSLFTFLISMKRGLVLCLEKMWLQTSNIAKPMIVSEDVMSSCKWRIIFLKSYTMYLPFYAHFLAAFLLLAYKIVN